MAATIRLRRPSSCRLLQERLQPAPRMAKPIASTSKTIQRNSFNTSLRDGNLISAHCSPVKSKCQIAQGIEIRPVYGPPNYKPGPPLFALPHFQTTATFPHYGFNSLVLNQTQGGYPERKYPFGDHTLEFLNNGPELYTPLIRPPFSTNEPWWKRYDPFTRKKRQSGSTTALCPTFPQFIMPKAGLNNKGNWMYVVNLDTNRKYTQVVRTETCINPGRPCNSICNLPNGYGSRCEQQYVQKKLVALSGDGSDLHVENFWLPHCCICQITQNNR